MDLNCSVELLENKIKICCLIVFVVSCRHVSRHMIDCGLCKNCCCLCPNGAPCFQAVKSSVFVAVTFPVVVTSSFDNSIIGSFSCAGLCTELSYSPTNDHSSPCPHQIGTALHCGLPLKIFTWCYLHQASRCFNPRITRVDCFIFEIVFVVVIRRRSTTLLLLKKRGKILFGYVRTPLLVFVLIVCRVVVIFVVVLRDGHQSRRRICCRSSSVKICYLFVFVVSCHHVSSRIIYHWILSCHQISDTRLIVAKCSHSPEQVRLCCRRRYHFIRLNITMATMPISPVCLYWFRRRFSSLSAPWAELFQGPKVRRFHLCLPCIFHQKRQPAKHYS